MPIKSHRAFTELQLQELLYRANAALTLEQVRQLVFEADTTDFRQFIIVMLDTVGATTAGEVHDGGLQIIEDAWNYFPHRALDGKCPAELVRRERLRSS